VTVARNLGIVLVVAAGAYLLPGGGDAASLVGAVVTTLVTVVLVLLAARFYQNHRTDIYGLGDRHRGYLYGAIGAAVLALAGTDRLMNTGAGTVVWFALLGGAVYALVLVWRQYRAYGL
jgi:hypothetical protein